ncbi:MAG TPA: WYL domain-containing protein [Acidimicrobiales bacterium]|nr:WYL domain-containing protein [Acidimicrobiales bacterium]
MSGAKLERLLNLTALLLETPRPLAAREIRERLDTYYPDETEAFRRAFERDKDDLRAMGVPLEVQDVPGVVPAVEGYRIPKDRYYLRDPGLEPDELAALRLAASLVQLDGVSAREGLLKLGGLVGGDTPDEGGPGLAVGSLPGGNVAPLFGAIAAQCAVRFTYRGEERTIEPHRLDFARGRWYLSGHDRGRGEPRVFRLDRFETGAVVLPDDRFERPTTAQPGVQLDPWTLGEGQPVEARVLVDAAQAPWIVQHLGPGAVADERPDGSVVVTMAVTNRENFRSFVLTFLDHAEVLDPPDLRDEIVAWLRRQAA